MRIEGERGDGTERKRGKRKVEVGKKGDGMEMCLERGSSDVIFFNEAQNQNHDYQDHEYRNQVGL